MHHSLSGRRFNIKTRINTFVFRLILLGALLLPTSGFSQLVQSTQKFYENGQATRLGADAGMFPDSPTRLKIDLAGLWQYSLDGNNWNATKIPGAYDFTGKVTFTRKFGVKPEMLEKYTFSLVVYGISYQSEITINGNFIGRHTGSYSSFVLPIPDKTLQVGSENAVRVFIDNELTPKTTLPLRQRVDGWRTYGGIYRDIYILATPKLTIEQTEAGSPTITSDNRSDTKGAKIQLRSTVTDAGYPDSLKHGGVLGVQVEVYDKLSGVLAGRSGIAPLSFKGGKTVEVSNDIVIPGVKLWSPETPDLYIMKCQIVRSVNKELSVIDEYSFDYGFRDVQWKDGRLFVNGTVTNLKGILWQEDHISYGSALTYEVLEKDIASIKTLGANLIRFLYPPHPYMLNLCDRYGIFVMEEIPMVGVPADIILEDYYQDLSSTYVKEMVARDRLHTSILAWGIGRELETSQPPVCEYLNNLRNLVQSVDARPVYYAASTINDPCFEYVDLVAIDTRYADVKTFRDSVKGWKTANVQKPMIVARYGHDIQPGNRNGYSDPLSLEAQARFANQAYESIKDAKLAGGVLWSFNDWRSDRPALTAYTDDPYLRAMGVVGSDREKRPAFDVVRAMFNGEKVQALPVGNYSSSTPVIYVLAGLVILLAFMFFYNGNRRFRDCVNRSMIRTYNFFADVRDQRILTYGHSFFLALIVSVTWATLLSSILSYYRDSILLDNLLSHFLSDPVKEDLIQLVWNPIRFILIMSGVFFLKLCILSIIIKLLSMTVRAHVYFYHAFSVTMWSMLPYIIFIPVAMILYRLLESETYIVPVFILLAIVTFWVLFRLFKGVSIIYDVFPMKVYAVGFLIIIVASVVIYGYIDYTNSTSLYLKYMMQAMRETPS